MPVSQNPTVACDPLAVGAACRGLLLERETVLLASAKILVGLSILWAAAASAVQVLAARGGGRTDRAKPSGSPARGMVYNFTVAMTPAHKETVSRHPGKFAVGVVMHVGVILSLLGVVLLVVWPAAGFRLLSLVRPVAVLALAGGIYLFIRRVVSANLRAMSTPEDHIAILATCVLCALVSRGRVDAQSQVVLLGYAALLFVYLPLGKLRHAVFFFAARADYGRRLGYRGVYPPSSTGPE